MALTIIAPTIACAEDWSSFHACALRHIPAVDQAEPSLREGAKLIVDVLCINEAADLGNQMMRSKDRQSILQDRGFAGAFDTFLGVMRREATEKLFEARKGRMGLQ